jgi:hypothetical protein
MLTFPGSFRPTVINSIMIVGAITLVLSSKAFATDGRTAVGLCIDSTASGARCSWSVNDKGEINICNQNGCVYCPSATGQCVTARIRHRPIRTLPVGTKVNTPIGSFTVRK